MGAWSSKASTSEVTHPRIMYEPSKIPIVYSDRYNIGFWKLENLHPFDSKKYGKIYQSLVDKHLISTTSIYAPPLATEQQLLRVHTPEYLKSLNSSIKVAGIVEVPPVAMLPNSAVHTHLLEPMRYAVGGSLLASELAARIHIQQHQRNTDDEKHTCYPILQEPDEIKESSVTTPPGWSINLAGGYHHACGNAGGGFCVYADITLSILHVAQLTGFTKFMIVDLDAHQGNGYARDKLDGRFGDLDVYILDMYNSGIYPHDHRALRAINCPIPLHSGTGDEQYLSLLQSNLDNSLDTFKPQFVVYNGGTDCLAGDPLGRLDVSAKGIAKRDEIVFSGCLERNIAMVMLLSGGYQKSNAGVISDSIENLHKQFNLLAVSAHRPRPSTSIKEKILKNQEPNPPSQL